MKYPIALLFFAFHFALLPAQTPALPPNADANHYVRRLDILSGGNLEWHPDIHPYERSAAVEWANRADTSLAFRWSASDRRDMQYLKDDSNEWPADSVRRNRRGLLRYFYRTPANLFEVNARDFYLRVNPMLNFGLGREQNSGLSVFTNQRGIEIRGGIDDRVYFYTNVVESQVQAPEYVRRWVDEYRAIPGAVFYKSFKSELFNVSRGYDFNLANAYAGFRATRHVGVEFGHGQHFIGNGYRSLLLSDDGAFYLYLKLNTRIWRLQYQNLFVELLSKNPVSSTEPLPKKYAAIHYLNFNASPRISIGFFEATVFNRGKQFEFQYLNPVILYRTVEGMINSPDNVLIGMDVRWDLFRSVRLYGQLLLDEFRLKDVYRPEQKGWWGNKFGVQAGLQYVNALNIDHLDLRLEFNTARPYTYSHFDSLSSYTHYNQPLAHPLWANFREILGIARYQPHPRLLLEARYVHDELGENSATENWGANPLVPYATRVQEYGNTTGQGVSARLDILGFDASWQLYHNLFIDLNFAWRRKDSDDADRDLESMIYGGSLRMNFWPKHRDF